MEKQKAGNFSSCGSVNFVHMKYLKSGEIIVFMKQMVAG